MNIQLFNKFLGAAQNSVPDICQNRVEAVIAKQTPRESIYALHLIAVLWPHRKHGLCRFNAIQQVKELRKSIGLSVPLDFDRAVQSAFNMHNGDSDVFQRRGFSPERDLFYPVDGKGSGVWAVHRQIATAWLAIAPQRQEAF
jgi:hypothetical protein